ncbi:MULTISPECIES: AAA family ATPase [Pseudomonas]|uniref:AAA family ATPase n=1 Tax=Pseudomonas salmasensis TaxID=2745514 RepID=A0ABU5FMQ8_9PSED|nr:MULTISPECIES: AAA family ATPase [Pseudomonas]MDY4301572.1 AAA family ATPase [Pseudomonas salmasensis]CRM39489.1 putative ATP-binding protein involved in virulence [Pseudomonas sp. 35 E 8]
MLRSFKITTSNLDAQVSLYDGEDTTFDNWISVLIGQNGSRKSFILRQILDAATGETNKVGAKALNFESEGTNWNDGLSPDSITCISGTPLDRFPRMRNYSLGISISKSKQGLRNEFLYLGPRASNGMTGTAPSERALMTALFLNADKLAGRAHLFNAIFSAVGFRPKIRILLRLERELSMLGRRYNAKEPALTPSLPERAMERIFKYSLRPFLDSGYVHNLGDRLEKALGRILNLDYYGFFELIKIFHSDEPPVFVFEDGRIQLESPSLDLFGIGGDELEIYIRAGVVLVGGTTFYKAKSEIIHDTVSAANDVELNGEDLSSGQWSWLAGFAGLCAGITQESLILIDEPENSLHPIWQQTYVPTLNKILREFKGSQAVIVTHSPLIASGVDPEWGRVEALLNQGVDEGGRQVVRSKTVNNTFGWRASDVYEEVFQVPSSRAPAFTKTADIVLGLLRSGEPVSRYEYKFLKNELSRDLKTLPLTDPLRNVLTSIIKDLEARLVKENNNV